MVSDPVDYANACNQPSVFFAPSQGKSNLLWLLAETPLRLEPLLIYGMQIYHLQSILRCEKVIGRPCVLILYAVVEVFKACNSVTKVAFRLSHTLTTSIIFSKYKTQIFKIIWDDLTQNILESNH